MVQLVSEAIRKVIRLGIRLAVISTSIEHNWNSGCIMVGNSNGRNVMNLKNLNWSKQLRSIDRNTKVQLIYFSVMTGLGIIIFDTLSTLALALAQTSYHCIQFDKRHFCCRLKIRLRNFLFHIACLQGWIPLEIYGFLLANS